MSGYLLDTNIISKLAPGKQNPDGKFAEWMRETGASGKLYVSAMTVAEIEKGVRKLYRAGGVERAGLISRWLDQVLGEFGEQVLPMNSVVARVAGAMDDDATSRGHNPGLADIIIAATARAYDLTLVTENVKDFEGMGVRLEFPSPRA